jgi:exopolysaccharide production protein ExoQ
MPPILAAALTLFGVLYLLRRDAWQGETSSSALWLPVLWLGITGSRFVSQWLDLGGGSGGNFTEGSPIDAVYFATLIGAGLWTLHRRDVRLGGVIRANGWLFALMAYGLLSVLWSDFPVTAGKRWIKTLGHPVMALIILTEPDPAAALRTVLKRCAFILLPVSVLFIKYFPEYGRGFDPWTGEAFNNGVGLTKNDLGYLCMVSGILFSWNLLTVRRLQDKAARRFEIALSLAFLWMVAWLLKMSNSQTSLVAMVLGIGMLFAVDSRLVSRRFFGTYVVIVVLVVAGLEATFDLYHNIIIMRGRDPSLTDRTAVWADVLAMQQRPLVGYGFESFWLGDRLVVLWNKWWWRPTQAHNGYIETYLNLGFVGLALLAGLLLSTFRRISRQLLSDFDFARLRLALLFAILLFNYTEAAFKAVHFIWTIFFVIAMEAPKRRQPDSIAALPRRRTSDNDGRRVHPSR